MVRNRLERRRRGGFTLIELVVVLIIVATLAGLAIPLVSMLGRSSDMAAIAASQKELANNLELYFVLQKRFPQGLDSLLTGGTAVYSPDVDSSTLQTKGLPASSANSVTLHKALKAADFTNASGEHLRSITRCGFEFVYDHDNSVINSNDSAVTVRPLTGSSQKLAEIDTTTTDGKLLIDRLSPSWADWYPNSRYIAVGIGPRNLAIGKTINSSPIYPGCDGKYYGRFVAVFRTYATGERATLVGVVDSYGRTPDYTIQQFNESLPDGGRQG